MKCPACNAFFCTLEDEQDPQPCPACGHDPYFPDKSWKHSTGCAWHDDEPCTCKEAA